MYRTLLKGLGIVSILGGIYHINLIIQLIQTGAYPLDPSYWSPTLLLRMCCLIACGLAAWYAPKYAALFSFGAFFLSFSSAITNMYDYGLIKGLTNLPLAYYLMVSVYGIAAILIWWFAKYVEE